MIKQKIEEVDIAQLKPHPKCANIYSKLDDTELCKEIEKNGILHPPVVDNQYRIIGGERVVEAAKLIGLKKIKVSVVDVSEEDAPAFRVFTNTIRNKSYSEIFKEVSILRAFWGTRQGQRPVMMEDQAEVEKLNLRERMEKITGVDGSTIYRVETLGKKNLLCYADTGAIPLTALIAAVKDENGNELCYKPIEEISLNPVCCEKCHQPTGRIVFTKANELAYKDQTSNNEIKF
ncbi:MAG TPA: ParB/RepB/Spo0J family partition protein [Bacteroidia bacterium]|jgi:hypothetical protein|nr:ParB/RepB/Spo0J family partition protein [Bacteroidia bacterium]